MRLLVQVLKAQDTSIYRGVQLENGAGVAYKQQAASRSRIGVRSLRSTMARPGLSRATCSSSVAVGSLVPLVPYTLCTQYLVLTFEMGCATNLKHLHPKSPLPQYNVLWYFLILIQPITRMVLCHLFVYTNKLD